jgi:ligand-binding sensor domain-containing protein
MAKFYTTFIFVLFFTSIRSQNQNWIYYSLEYSVTRIVIEEDALWINGSGLTKINTTSWEKINYQSSNSEIPENNVFAIAIDKSGNKWIGHSDQGLTKFDGTNWTPFNPSNSGIPGKLVNNIVFDKDENIWIVCNGITKFDGTDWTNFNDSNSDLPSTWIWSFAIDGYDNKWIGTYENGIVKFDGTNWSEYNMDNSGLPADWVYSIAVDDSQNIWIGTMGGGLAKFDGETWSVYNKSNSGLPNDSINCITIDSNRNKWLGTQSGLVKFNGDEWNLFTSTSPDGYSKEVYAIAIDENGNKWIGTNAGIAAFNETGIVSVEEDIDLAPTEFSLSQNYPNPFNPSTTINYKIPEESHVQIKVYDVMGREIKELVNDQKKAGSYRINFDGSNLSSGVYLCKINAGRFSGTRKMLLVK